MNTLSTSIRLSLHRRVIATITRAASNSAPIKSKVNPFHKLQGRAVRDLSPVVEIHVSAPRTTQLIEFNATLAYASRQSSGRARSRIAAKIPLMMVEKKVKSMDEKPNTRRKENCPIFSTAARVSGKGWDD